MLRGTFRKLAAVAALCLFATSSNLYALGLGEIEVQSALNQPMKAVIGLTSTAGTDLSKVKVAVASREAHQRQGISKARVLGNFSFNVDGSGPQPVIRVTSVDVIRDPFLTFLLEIEWANGRLLREYTVLIDPPVLMPATPVIPAAPVTSAPATVYQEPVRQSRAVTTPPVSAPVRVAAPTPVATTPVDHWPVRRSETLWSLAKQLRPDSSISIEQMMLALQRANPQAFMHNNINNLKAGATLRVPDRGEITSLSVREASAEAARQFAAWKEGSTPVSKEVSSESTLESTPAPEVAEATESRLQLMAPDGEPTEGQATPDDTGSEVSKTASGGDLSEQLALASEEAEAGRAQSEELQSRVNDLENQIDTMKRLLVLKDDELAVMQQQVEISSSEQVDAEIAGEQAVADTDVAEEPAAADDEAAAGLEPAGIVNKLMDNPVLAGLGILVAILLGGFLWASTRQRSNHGIFDEEMTLEKHMANEAAMDSNKPAQVVVNTEQEERSAELDAEQPDESAGNGESDPLTEADVYLAYGRIQQAEDVLQAALQDMPADNALKIKLMEVYHTAGNAAAFDREASEFRATVAAEDDSQWLKVAEMGRELSPDSELYRIGTPEQVGQDNDIDFDMDLSGLDEVSIQDVASDDLESDNHGLDVGGQQNRPDLPESIEFNLDDEGEDVAEGLLDNADEVSTKLDLARAYIDMGDPEGARSILEEVVEEGNKDQVSEAKALALQLA
jgi:pilus assembly protein FimV